jgi:flagellar FliJ protein
MPKRFPLQSLLDLAQQHTDTAAKNLQLLKVQWNEAEEKLQQLLHYQKEYRERLQQAAVTGMNISAMRDYQAFLGKIEVAIGQQGEEVERRKRSWEAGQQAWHAQKRKLGAFDVLAKRHRQGELHRESRQEQREQDEFASKAPQRKSFREEDE